MAKTELGCQVLQEKGHFVEFSQFIRLHGKESEDTDLISKLKSILWAVVRVVTLLAEFSGSEFFREASARQKAAYISARRRKLFQLSWR
jgi:hypothetical protein